MARKNTLTSAPPCAVEQVLHRLGANLRIARLRRNLTIEDVAEKIGTGRRGIPTGKFVYGRAYLENENQVSIDPLELKLGNKTYETNILKGVFGALRDAGPDYWGRRVIEKRSGQPQLGEVDYLLHSPDDRAGALGIGRNVEPPAPRRGFNRTLELERLQELADAIIADEEIPDEPETEQAQDLMFGGTSMGGARPKAVVEDDNNLWIAKFNRADDKLNDARKVITIGGRDVLMVKRFDRGRTDAGYRRGRILSALTLLRADDDPRRRGI